MRKKHRPTLTAPAVSTASGPKWYEQYPRLNSARFTVENSGARHHLPPPYAAIHDGNGNVIGIEGYHGLESLWTVVGYTESLPYPHQKNDAVGILFESTTDFEQIWWHYPEA